MKVLSPEQFGAMQDPPRSAHQILRLCRAGRIRGALKPRGEWLILPHARVVGTGQRVEYGENTGLSVLQYANKYGVSKARVYKLLKQGRIDGAKYGPHGWDIPEDADWPVDDF